MPVLKTWSQDKRVKFWVEDHHSPEPIVDRERLVGFFLPVLGKKDLAEGMYHSFVSSMPLNYPFAMIVLDGGSDDGTLEFFTANVPTYTNTTFRGATTIEANITGLVKPPTENVACELLLGEYSKEKDRFEYEEDFGYVGYLHTDMTFPQVGWVAMLVAQCEKYPEIGILGPRTDQCWAEKETDQSEYRNDCWNKEGFITASVAPFIVPTRVLKEHFALVGGLIDPELWFQVGHCDWDMHRRNMTQLGYRSYIYKNAIVKHPMCGTRPTLHKLNPKRDTAVRDNAAYYEKKWGVPWNYDVCREFRKGQLAIERTV